MLIEDGFMSDEEVRQPDESERVSRLSSVPSPDEVVKEYEQQYGTRQEGKRKSRELPRSYSTLNVTDEERLWAAIAHGSVWLTLITGLLTLGVSVPVSIFIPLVIYFLFRRRSDYVAFHALQAFVIQLLGTVGALTLLTVGGAAWIAGMVIALLAVFVLVGAILVPLWGIVGVLLGLAVFLMPVAMLLFGTIATIETYHGRDYRYPFIAQWVDRQLAGGFLNMI
jgi:uncharacterized Tic20 family protein